MRFIRLRPFLRKFSTPLTVFLAVFLCLLTPSLAVGVEGQKPSKFDLTLSYALKHTDEAYNVSESSGGYDKALAIAEAAGDICDPENDKADLLVFDPVQVFVETNDHCVELYQFVENEGGCLEARTENYCTVVIPFYALKDMGELESVIRVEASQPMAPSMDKSRDNSVGIGLSSTSSVENLAAYKNYDGRGIAVGIIDNGTDVSLDSFKDRYGKTRIDYYWDQSCSKGTPPSGRTYGTEYTASNINAGTALDENDKPIGSGSDGNGSHGTHVAGTVAGRDAKYPGIAPEARIIVVKLSGFNMNNDSGNFSAAVDYILEKASAMGLPCVINCSMGLMFHDHGYDGASVLEKAMQRRVETQNCILCKSSGNENDEQGVAIGSGIKHVWVSNYVGSTHITESSYRYSTIYVYMPSDYANSNLRLYCENSQGQEEAKTITTNVANLTADKYYQWSLNDTTLRTWDTSSSDQTTYPYKLHVTSVEKLDRYGDDGVTDTLHLELRFFHYGANDEYKVGISCSNPDTHYYASYDTICFDSDDCEESGSLSAPIVPGWITVGAYGARKTWKDSSGSSYSYQTSYLPSVKALFPFSSCGPPRIMNRFTGNDEYKPDIIAPGGFMISQKASQYTGYSASRIIDDSHVGMQGTSMSSPMVAGFVALLLQKWPNATADQIKTLLYDKAVTTDTANTGTVPNHRAGHGKLNAASLNSTAVSVPAPKVYTAKRVKNASGQLVAGKMALLGVNFEREATVSINGTALDASNYEYCSHRKIIVSDDRFTSALLNTISANGSVSETAIGAEDIVSSTTSAPSGFNYKIRVTNPHAPSASQTSNWGNEPSSVPYVTGIEKADASSCWVCVINPAVSGTPTVSSGTVTIAKGSSSPVTCAISSYDSAKQAFRVNISNFGALSSYLMGSSVGLPDAYKIAYNRSSDNVSSTAFVYGPFADIAPTQPEAGAYSVVNDGGKRYLKLTGTALDRVDQVSYSGSDCTFIVKSASELWVSLPDEVIDVIINGYPGSTPVTYTLILTGTNGGTVSYPVNPKPMPTPAFSISKIESDPGFDKYLYLTLSDDTIQKGTCFINGTACSYNSYRTGRFNIGGSNMPLELVSYINGWTDTLSQRYTLKFVASDGSESVLLTYEKTATPDLVSSLSVTGIEGIPYEDGNRDYKYVYIKTNGYGGALYLNGTLPEFSVYSAEKKAYRIKASCELWRWASGQDRALSQDYSLVFLDSSGSVTGIKQFTAQRDLQPEIVQVAKYSSTNKAYLYVRNCAVASGSNGTSAGNAVVKINGTAVTTQTYTSGASAYFVISVPSDLYAFLKDGTELSSKYRITVTSDEGIESEAAVYPIPVIPEITQITKGSNSSLAKITVNNCANGEVFVNGRKANATYTASTQSYSVSVDYALGEYLSGKSKTLSQSYVFRVKNPEGFTSEAFTVDKVVLLKPSIAGLDKYTSTSTTYAYLKVKNCTSGTVYMDDVKRTTCSYVASKQAFRINVPTEVGKYLTGKSTVMPNKHTFKVVSSDGVASAVYTLKATVSAPVISKVVQYSATSTAYAYVYCSNTTSGTVYMNNAKRTATYEASKKAFKVSVPAELAKYLTGKSEFLSKDYSFKVVNQNGSISAIKTVLANPDVPKITSVGKYLSNYVYVYVSNCGTTGKVYVNGTLATSSYVSSKNAFKVKVDTALGNYLLGKVSYLAKDYTFKVVSNSKTSAITTVPFKTLTPSISKVLATKENKVDVYVSNIVSGGTVYLDGCAAVHGTTYSASKKAFTDVVVPYELGRHLLDSSNTLTQDFKFTVTTKEGKTSAAKTIKKSYPAAAPAILGFIADEEGWFGIKLDNCSDGKVYIDGILSSSVWSDGTAYALADNELSQFINGDTDELTSSWTVKVTRGDGKSCSKTISASASRESLLPQADGLNGEEIHEIAAEAEADMLALRKEALLEGETIGEDQPEALDPEIAADVEELLRAEDEYADSAEMTEAEEDKYVIESNENPSGLVIADGDEDIEFPEDQARSLSSDALEARLFPRITAVRPLSGRSDALVIYGENFSGDCAVMIGDGVFETSSNLGHSLVVEGLPETLAGQVLSGEAEVHVISRLMANGSMKELISSEWDVELVDEEPVPQGEASLSDEYGSAGKENLGSAAEGQETASKGGDGQDGGHCFIATAAYGSYLEPEVKVLRAFRDAHLLTNAPGRAFVKFYYANSPAVASFIAARPWARCATRMALTPVVFGVAHPGLGAVLIALLIGGGAAYRRRRDDTAI